MNSFIGSYFGLEPAPETPEQWHLLLLEGFDQLAFKHCAQSLGVTHKALAHVLGMSRAPHKGEKLSTEQSNQLYGLVCLIHEHCRATKGRIEQAWQWLRTPHPGLKNETPLALNATSFGREYALTAVSRI